MIFFKKLIIDNYSTKDIEKALRTSAVKSNVILDFCGSSYNTVSKGLYFYGYENKKTFQLSRLRFPIEFIFPKLIISFNKSNFNEYKVRLGFMTFSIFLVLLLAFIVNIYQSLKMGYLKYTFIEVSFYFGIICLFIAIELFRTKRVIQKVISDYSLKHE